MSYTIIHDHEYEARQRTNLINEIKRHCKIGKVTRKYLPTHLRLDDAPMAPAWWQRPYPAYDPFQDIRSQGNRKCSCKPGQACGNAACPHGLFATSGAGYTSPTATWLS